MADVLVRQPAILDCLSPRAEAERLRPYFAEVLAGLEQGHTLPAELYYHPAVYEVERELVFGRTWQLVGLSLDVERPGTYTTVAVDEFQSFVVARDRDGRLRAFANACAHRGNRLLEGSGTCDVIQCGYHGWTYNVDGSLRHARLMETAADFDPADFHLRAAAVEAWGPFLFLNPDAEAEPLQAFLGDLPQKLADLGVDMDRIARESRFAVFDTTFECNWKIATENSLECYHCAVVHPGLAATVDLPRWQIGMSGNCIVQGSRLRPPTQRVSEQARQTRLGPLATEAARHGGIDLAYFYYLFPNNSIAVWPGPGNSFNIGRFIPAGPERTRRWSVRWWSTEVAEQVRQEQWDFIMAVAQEDRTLIEGLQTSMRSRGWHRGRFQLEHPGLGEHAIRQFNTLLVQKLLA